MRRWDGLAAVAAAVCSALTVAELSVSAQMVSTAPADSSAQATAAASSAPQLLREMRGIWVATVANIDYPSASNLTPEQLRQEARDIIERSQRMGLNAIFFQVRPSADALYKSKLEPLSSYLVKPDKAKGFDFDALQYWLDEAHRHGLELHAWVNPFRVTPKADFACGANHLSKKHPDWTVTYAEKLYLNPGLPQARQWVTNVVMDIVNRYDVDGIHFDDYFYPYPAKGEVFNDDKAYRKYNPGKLSLDDWRRSNVTAVVRAVSDSIRAVKPWVQFGISPFGVWRNQRDDPKGSATMAGITNYDILYADVLDWIEHRLIDYAIPQIYWEQGNKLCDFGLLQKWWSEHSTPESRIFVGHAVYRINQGKFPRMGWNRSEEMPEQLQLVRDNDHLDGSVFFSYRQFNRNILGFESYLADDFYAAKSLQPVVAKGEARPINITHLERDGDYLRWQMEGDSAMLRFFLVYRTLRSEVDKMGSNASVYALLSEPRLYMPMQPGRRQRYVYRVAAVDKFRVIHDPSRRLTVRE